MDFGRAVADVVIGIGDVVNGRAGSQGLGLAGELVHVIILEVPVVGVARAVLTLDGVPGVDVVCRA